jgi:hypothetical protein
MNKYFIGAMPSAAASVSEQEDSTSVDTSLWLQHDDSLSTLFLWVLTLKIILFGFLRFLSNAAEVSVFLGFGAATPNGWCPIFRDYVVVSSTRVKSPVSFFLDISTFD